MPKIIEIGKYLFKLELKMSGVFFLRHTVVVPSQDLNPPPVNSKSDALPIGPLRHLNVTTMTNFL